MFFLFALDTVDSDVFHHMGRQYCTSVINTGMMLIDRLIDIRVLPPPGHPAFAARVTQFQTEMMMETAENHLFKKMGQY